MTGKIKIIGANNQSHIGWMEMEFENCTIDNDGGQVHSVKIPERGEFPFDIYKCVIVENRIALEGYAHIDGSLGRLAIEFCPQ